MIDLSNIKLELFYTNFLINEFFIKLFILSITLHTIMQLQLVLRFIKNWAKPLKNFSIESQPVSQSIKKDISQNSDDESNFWKKVYKFLKIMGFAAVLGIILYFCFSGGENPPPPEFPKETSLDWRPLERAVDLLTQSRSETSIGKSVWKGMLKEGIISKDQYAQWCSHADALVDLSETLVRETKDQHLTLEEVNRRNEQVESLWKLFDQSRGGMDENYSHLSDLFKKGGQFTRNYVEVQADSHNTNIPE